jgi:hypothetical protein
MESRRILTKLVSSRVFQPKGVKLRKSDQVFGYIHPYLAYPLSDLEFRQKTLWGQQAGIGKRGGNES